MSQPRAADDFAAIRARCDELKRGSCPKSPDGEHEIEYAGWGLAGCRYCDAPRDCS